VLHLTAFGLGGPYSDQPGFGRIAEAFAELTHINGEPDRPPYFPGVGLVGSIERCFELVGAEVVEVAVDPVAIEPVDPAGQCCVDRSCVDSR
jgi:hypothetical protein